MMNEYSISLAAAAITLAILGLTQEEPLLSTMSIVFSTLTIMSWKCSFKDGGANVEEKP